MADELIAATVMVLLEKAIAVAADRIGLMLGFYDDLKAMESHAKDIQAVLADAETKQSRNPIVLRWLKKVEGAAFEAENVLDELLYESLRRKVYETNGGTVKVCSFFHLSKHDISFRTRMGSRVRVINEKLKIFNREVLDIGLIRVEDSLLSHGNTVMVEAVSRQTDSFPQLFVAGRGKEEYEIVNMLLGSSDNNVPVSVLPIVGMGGLGKTTLAKSIYNHERIVGCFSKRSWICVSNKFDVTNILLGILESLKEGGKVEITSRDAIVHGIQKEISGKRFLFVFDDVWNEEPKLWDDLFTSLIGLNNSNGSCCVLTTRLQTTANLVSTCFSPFVLDKLSDNACWSILGTRATKGGPMPRELDVHKKQILKRCQGVPLAASAIGGLLRLQRKEDWLSIVENTVLKVSQSIEGEIAPILKLSYDYLPSPRIKKCFVCCSKYPKDAQLNGEELIEIWMAEGFLQEETEGRMTTEEVGYDYLTVLLQTSLLEKVRDKYQMHDLFHDLAESISKREQFDDEYRYLQFQHLALCDEEDMENTWNARSPLVQIVKDAISGEMLLKYKHVHVLHLSSQKIKSLPNAIGKLKHLRYLDVSTHAIKSLPESLCKLYNLQTLSIDRCFALQRLPQGLSHLISLRQLHFFSGEGKLKMPPNMGRLTCLQTLEFFNIGKKNGCGVKELGPMRNLKGIIRIRNLELVKGKEEAKSAKLLEKHSLQHLELSWGSTVRDNCDDERVLEGLEPCPTLRALRITNFMGVRFPRWLGKLLALEKLVLDDCKSCTQLVHLEDGGAFSKLVHLEIYECCQLSSVPSRFPSLELLTIVGNVQVSVVRDIVGKCISSLRVLSLKNMSRLISLSDVIENPLMITYPLGRFEICGCDGLAEMPSSTLECFTSLKCLRVEKCPNLLSCPLNLQRTPLLLSLKFSSCPKVFTTNAMPTGFHHLTKLCELSIGPFSNDSIQLFDWSGLIIGCSSSLVELSVYASLQNHSFLPEQLQHLHSLAVLRLIDFESLELLPDWFINFPYLRQLDLTNCLKLQHFLPTHVMERLSYLRATWIKNCPLLKQSLDQVTSDFPNLTVHWNGI